jgi:nitroreductase
VPHVAAMTIDPALVPAAPRENEPTALPNASLDALKLMALRRSPKPFHLAVPAPRAAQLETILTLAARTPDHGKLNPWRFIVFEGEARHRAGEALAAVMAARGDATAETIKAARESLSRAPMVVAVVSTARPHVKIPEWEQVLSAGAVSYGLIMAAQAFGFGAVWLTGWPAYDADARAALGLKDDEKLAALIHIGTQIESQPERARPDMPAIVTRF